MTHISLTRRYYGRQDGEASSSESAIARAKALLEPLTDRSKRIKCPYPGHEDRHPSAVLWPDHFYCFACGEGGDSLDYYCLSQGSLSIADALRALGVSNSSLRVGAPPRFARPPKLSQAVERLFLDALAGREPIVREWAVGKVMASYEDEAALVADFYSATFLNLCRRHKLDALLIHDVCFLLREVA